MNQMKLGVACRVFDSSIKRALDRAAELGVSGVQIDARHDMRPEQLSNTGRRQFLHGLSERGLRVGSVTFPLRRRLYDPDQISPRIEALKTALSYAYELKSSILTIPIGRIPHPEDDGPSFDALVEVLNDLASHGNRVGTTLSITPGPDTADTLQKLLDRVQQGRIGIDLDPASAVLAGESAAQAYRTLHQSVTHVRIRDAQRDLDGMGQETPVGRGAVAWDELLALLDEAAYSGWLMVDRTSGSNRSGDATHAIQYMRSLGVS
ncbi:MAG: sugar phosphate isomerase/epimerase family protein [Planctomycetaceae bacterium]